MYVIRIMDDYLLKIIPFLINRRYVDTLSCHPITTQCSAYGLNQIVWVSVTYVCSIVCMFYYGIWWLNNEFIFHLELPLGNKDKPLAVLNSNWHQIVQHLSLSSIEVPVVCVRRNVHFPVDKEKLLTDPVTLNHLFSDVSQCRYICYN